MEQGAEVNKIEVEVAGEGEIGEEIKFVHFATVNISLSHVVQCPPWRRDE